jgi:RHS repeat-associated protein
VEQFVSRFFAYLSKGEMQTALNYYGHRFYNSDTGRWLNRDPIAAIGNIKVMQDDAVEATCDVQFGNQKLVHVLRFEEESGRLMIQNHWINQAETN